MQLTGVTPPYLCACSKPASYVVVRLCSVS